MGGGPKRQSADNQVAICKRCRLGIYKGAAVYWQRTPTVGLIHAHCAEGGVVKK